MYMFKFSLCPKQYSLLLYKNSFLNLISMELVARVVKGRQIECKFMLNFKRFKFSNLYMDFAKMTHNICIFIQTSYLKDRRHIHFEKVYIDIKKCLSYFIYFLNFKLKIYLKGKLLRKYLIKVYHITLLFYNNLYPENIVVCCLCYIFYYINRILIRTECSSGSK